MTNSDTDTNNSSIDRVDTRSNEDSFGKLIADGTQNQLDIASQYNFSPERLRLFKDGTRQFVQYGSITGFTDREKTWRISPGQGEDWHIESAESVTYVVGFVNEASQGIKLSRSLEDGDVLKVGPRGQDTGDGWYIEQRGTDHDDKTVDIKQLDGGTETTLESDVTIPNALTSPARIEARFNWYGVGSIKWRQTYTENGEQKNEAFAEVGVDDDFTTESANLNLYCEIERGASSSAIDFDVASLGAAILGNPISLTRAKPQFKQITVSGSTNTWEPIYAVRIDPSNDKINCQFTELEILDYSANADIELVVASMAASKTDASGWSRPDYHHDQNSTLQTTTSISQVPDTSGTQKDLTSTDKFGGYTMASAVDVDGGNAEGDAATSNRGRQEKKAVLASDHVVFLARTGTVDADLSFVWTIDQNW